MDYLKDVKIAEPIKEILLGKLNSSLDLDTLKSTIEDAIRAVVKSQVLCTAKEWQTCSNECFTVLSHAIQTEVHSTAYILRCLSRSIISTRGEYLTFTFDLDVLANDPASIFTGLWADDSKHFHIEPLDPSRKPRLIMGLGPSASGKTYWAKTLIALLSKDPIFPRSFLSIDGGILRESSIVYQTIIEVIETLCLKGFDNLVLSSYNPLKSSMFDSDLIKKAIIHYLKTQVHISLYVPETLGACGTLRPKSCMSKIEDYISITNDTEWVGIFIWQHKHGGQQCPYKTEFECVGCIESGSAREIKEGKKYSSGSYDHSFAEGLKLLETAPGGHYNIHNSGAKDKKTLIWSNTELLSNRNDFNFVVNPSTPAIYSCPPLTHKTASGCHVGGRRKTQRRRR
jgi:hypothetical protein